MPLDWWQEHLRTCIILLPAFMFLIRRRTREIINHEAVKRKAVNVANPDCVEDPSSATALAGITKWVFKVIFLPEEQLLAAASFDRGVHVYEVDTAHRRHAPFDCHSEMSGCAMVRDVVQLDCDLVASVGWDKNLFSWRPKSDKLLATYVHNAKLTCIAKLDDSRVIVGDDKGKVIVLTHDSGTAFQVHRRFRSSHSGEVNGIVVHRDLIVTCSLDKTAKLCSATSFALLATLRHLLYVTSAAVSDNFIVTTCNYEFLCVYRNSDDYPLEIKFRMDGSHYYWKTRVAIFNEDVIVVGEEDEKLSFISLSTKSFLSRIDTKGRIISFDVLGDGRIVIGTWSGAAIISPPESVRAIVQQYAAASYQSLSPVQSARGAAQLKLDTLLTTLSNDIEEELEQWRENGVSKDVVGGLKSGNMATCLAAYLVNYDGQLGKLFVQYKCALTERFQSTGTFGEHFIDADEDDKNMLFDEVVLALTNVNEWQSLGPAKMRVKKFMRLASN